MRGRVLDLSNYNVLSSSVGLMVVIYHILVVSVKVQLSNQ